MSWEAMTWALEDAPGVPTHLVAVLMGLANHAGKTGRGAFASQATLAGYARKSDRAIRNDIKELLSLGLIIVSDDQSPAARFPGDARPVVYDLQLHLTKDVSSGTSLPPGSTVPPGSEVPLENQDKDGQVPAGDGSGVPDGSPLPGGSTASSDRKPTSDKPSTNQNPKKKTSSSSKRAPKSAAAEEPRPDVEALCQRLAELMIANECKPPTITKAWRDAARLMLDTDGRGFERALHLLEWSQKDPFWKSNIHSMPKFREKYDQLRQKALAEWEGERQRLNGYQPYRNDPTRDYHGSI